MAEREDVDFGVVRATNLTATTLTAPTLSSTTLGATTANLTTINSTTANATNVAATSIRANAARTLFPTSVIGTEAASTIIVTTTFKDKDGSAIAVPKVVTGYLSSAATGIGFASAVDALAAGTNGVLQNIVTGISFKAVTTAVGVLDVSINKQGHEHLYLVYEDNGTPVVSGEILFAS